MPDKLTGDMFTSLDERLSMAMGQITALEEAFCIALGFACRAAGSTAVVADVKRHLDEAALKTRDLDKIATPYQTGFGLLSQCLSNVEKKYSAD